MDLKPGETELVELPPPSRGVITVIVETESGFVPADQGSGFARSPAAWRMG
jgi:hypothetical protein